MTAWRNSVFEAAPNILQTKGDLKKYCQCLKKVLAALIFISQGFNRLDKL